MSRVRQFGRLADGREVLAITLGDEEGLQAQVLNYGAILRMLTIPTAQGRKNLVLALEDIGQYESDTAFVGPVVGRFANRIAQGRLSIDGHSHQLARNENGNHLHGGASGVGRQLWRVNSTPTPSGLDLALHSPAGDEGYPGNLDIGMSIRVRADALRVDFVATTDAPTPVNLTWHPYFNLGGEATQHWLRIPASHYLPVGSGLIPTGEIAPVQGTCLDFRDGKILMPPALNIHPQVAAGGGFDHCWVLDANADCHCELRSPEGNVTLTICGSTPGLQFYSGQYLSRAHPRIGSGVALEPQGFPDAPNQRGFPDAVLRPGAAYRAWIEYRISQN